jgi:hypothetical protein
MCSHVTCNLVMLLLSRDTVGVLQHCSCQLCDGSEHAGLGMLGRVISDATCMLSAWLALFPAGRLGTAAALQSWPAALQHALQHALQLHCSMHLGYAYSLPLMPLILMHAAWSEVCAGLVSCRFTGPSYLATACS